MSLPSLVINCVSDDILGLPLCNLQAKRIIDQVQFAEGEETTVAPHTWQLSPTKFSINNSRWSQQLQALLNEVKNELGCDPKMALTCELYKLLLHEPGGFFKVCIMVCM